MKIVDCFPFFAPTNEEILLLRVNMLKDVVDNFIIVESNKTHSGEPVERKFLEIARNLGLPMEKIVYVEHDIPDDNDLIVMPVDQQNAGANKSKESILCRVRERLQKDAVMDGMRNFDDDDVFIYGDADEIIDPKNVKWLAELVQQNSTRCLLKIPLVYLQGRADLRVYHRSTGAFRIWQRAMFMATKHQINKSGGFLNIRCGNMPYKMQFAMHGGQMIQDLGWHFAWMGTNSQRETKAKSFAHAFDKLQWMKTLDGYNDGAYKKFVKDTQPVEGGPAPDGFADHVLKRYPITKLPDMILKNQRLRDFFLPETDLLKEFKFSPCECFWCNKLSWPLLYDLDGKRTWFEVPRSCSVTIKETHPDRKQIFREGKEYKAIMKTKKGKEDPVVVFTDPVERFVSLINVYLTEGQRYYDYGKDIFNSFGKNLAECTKQEKIDLFFKNLHKISSAHQVHHFHPQCEFVDTKNFKSFTVINKHEVNDFFKINKVLNFTVKEITADDFSKDQIDFIKWIYISDYDFFERYG